MTRNALPESFGLTAMLLGLTGCGLSTLSCTAEVEAKANVKHHLLAAERAASGFSCGPLGEWSQGRGADTDSEFWLLESWIPEGIIIQWGSRKNKLGSRFFDLDFFENHEFEQFVFTEPTGLGHVYAVWGAASCEFCPTAHLDDYTDYPGASTPCKAADAGADASPPTEPNANDVGDAASGSDARDQPSAVTNTDPNLGPAK